MTFDKWFNKQSRLVQLILLLIPGVNWIVELLVRWSLALRKKDALYIIVALIVTLPLGIGFGILDFIWVLLFKHLILGK